MDKWLIYNKTKTAKINYALKTENIHYILKTQNYSKWWKFNVSSTKWTSKLESNTSLWVGTTPISSNISGLGGSSYLKVNIILVK